MIVVVTEGQRTEPEYLEGIPRSEGLTNVSVKTVSARSDPLAVVERAVIEHKALASDRLDGDAVWAAFDRDEHAHFDEALALARREGVKLAVSNPCIELWFLLHFERPTRLSRGEAKRRLQVHLPTYDKGAERLYHNQLRERTAEACTRASALNRDAERNGDALDNPSTYMVDLVASLLAFANPSHSSGPTGQQ